MRSRGRTKRFDPAVIILGVLFVAALPVLGFFAFKLLMKKPEVIVETEVVKAPRVKKPEVQKPEITEDPMSEPAQRTLSAAGAKIPAPPRRSRRATVARRLRRRSTRWRRKRKRP